MEVLSDNSSESTNSSKSPENEENKSNGSEKSNQIEKSNKLGNIYQTIRNIYKNILNKYPFIQYYIKLQFYLLFCIGIYYLSRRTSLLMSPYLMNNEYYRKIRGIHDIATN